MNQFWEKAADPRADGYDVLYSGAYGRALKALERDVPSVLIREPAVNRGFLEVLYRGDPQRFTPAVACEVAINAWHQTCADLYEGGQA